ncbi:MFS transporter [Nocardiopsis changdeensis]|uniref:MFS transporter n=1 Tax=Nocardiopsis changdeensis TaxID=2831969 RepID=A0ABX8BSW9_9ACTN|nr:MULTISPECIES: MFS transporter [Nocardiopsis]QUX25151.1 MFS transporter [Nocardiopsis changdeensis]QYX35538.1 MFS transporter [Nocardiopsis sp. MT53]
MSPAEPGAPVRATPRQWAGLIVLALPTMLLSLDLTVLYMAIPHLGADLGASTTELLWIMDIYGFMVAGFLITMGTFGDRIGRRRLLLIGAVAFGAASVIAAFSVSTEMLIAARVLLGIAGAMLMPPTLALITVMFKDPKQRSMAVAVWLMSFTVGGVLGPAVGGLLLEFFWWGSVFLLAVPVMAVLLVAGPFLLPEYRDSSAGRMDLVSVALSLTAILPVVYGMKEIAADAAVRAVPLLALAVGLAAGALFVYRQRRIAHPLLDLSLFSSRTFTGALLALLLGQVVFYSFTYHFTQFMQLVQGLSPFAAGLWFIPLGIASVVGATAAPILAAKYPPATVIGAGLALCALGFGAMAFVGPASGLVLFMTGAVVGILGAQPLLALSTDMVVSSAPPERTGTASGMSETGAEFGAAMGIATFGSLGAAIYASRVGGLLPEGLSAEEAESAQGSFAGLIGVVEGLSGPLADQVLAAGREAFMSGMNAVMLVSALLMLGTAGMVVVLLRHLPPIGHEDGAPEEDSGESGAAGDAAAAEPDRRGDDVPTQG